MNRLIVAVIAALVLANTGMAQNYPSRPIRFITPYAPGGGTDIVARLIAQKLTESLGQSVVVDNRAGGGGIVGTSLAATAAPDGYTMLMGTTGPLVVNPSTYRKLPYDVLRDFAPIMLISTAPHLLAVHPSVPVKSVKELIAFARANPERLSFSSGGTGGSSQLSGELFNVMANVRMVHVPYRGTGPAVLAVVSGEVALSFADVLTTLPHIKSGRIRGLAVTGAKRSPAVDLPTVAEAGLPGYVSGVWYGVLAPAKTHAAIVTRLNAELAKVLQYPEVREKLSADGSDIVGSSPEQFLAFIKEELIRWAKVVDKANIRAD